MGGGGKSQTSTQTVSIPPEVLARYNAVNARAEDAAKQPFQQYGGEFVAPLNPTQQAGIQATSDYSQSAQPYYQTGAGLTLGAAQNVGPLTQGQIGYYQNPYTQSVVGATQAALGQQFGQQQSQQQAEAIKAGAFGGERAGLQRAQLQGQQGLAAAQAIAPLYQQGYQQAVQTAQGQQGVIASDLARQMQAGQQLGGLGTGAQAAALQGAQAQIGAGTLGQQTKQAQDTAVYQQFLQERGYPFQIAQFLANIAEGTGALSGSTTTSTQPSSFFSDRRLKHDAEKIGETKDGLPIYSFKYNGDDRTQIGLMAQDVEKKHPEAVGMSGGYKTVDYEKALHPVKKAYGGGLDPNSMGGVVTEPGLFARGGYATAGAVVDPTDLSAILAQQRQSFGPFAAAGPYGQAAGSAPHGASGIVPQQQMHVPKLMTAGAPPKPADSGFQDLYKGYQGLNQIADDMTGKSLTRRFGEKTGLTQSPDAKAELSGGDMAGTSANAMTGNQNPAGGVAPMPMARPDASEMTSGGGMWDKFTSALGFEHGGVVPRQHFEGGGVSVNPYANRDPSESYIDDTIQEEDKSKLPEMLKPGGGGGGKGGGGLGSDIMGAANLIGAGKTLASAGSSLASFLPTLFLADGGVVPRQHFEEGGPAKEYFDYLTNEKGYEPHVAAGILGNAYHESSGLQPNIVGDSGKSIGLFQFHEKGEQPAFRQWASENKRDIADPYTQLDFVHNQLQGPYAGTLEKMRSAQDPSSSAEAFMRGYERPKEGPTAALDRRQAYANAIAGGERLPTFRAYTGNEGGFGQAAGQQAIQRATSGDVKGQDQLGFFDRNKGIILPVLQGLGAMAGSKSRYLGSAILEGLGAGAKAYGDTEAQQANIGQTKEITRSQEATTAANWITAAKSASFKDADGNAYVLTPKGKVLLSIYNQNPGYWGEPIAQPQMRAAVEKKPAAPPVEQDIYGEGAASKEKLPGTTGPSDQVKSNVEPQHIATSTPKFVSGAPTPYTLVGNNALQNIEVDKTRALSSNPEARALSAQESASQFKVINEEARKASSVAAQFDKLAESAMQLPETGLMSQGALLDMKSRWADYVNSILKTSNVGPDYWIAAKDVGTAQGMKKIQNALQLELGSKSIDALQTAVGAIPNANMSREGFIEAYAPERVRMQKAMDQARYVEDYRRAYDKKYGLSFNGGWSTANALRSFNDDNPQNQYDTDVARMKWLMSKKANENETYWSLYRSGKAPRHFSDRQTGGVGYRRYFEGYGQ